jgi:hypothetical protein
MGIKEKIEKANEEVAHRLTKDDHPLGAAD